MVSRQRRRVLKGLLGAGGMSTVGSVQMLLPTLGHAMAPVFNDYKALVIVFLAGGNDAHNMIVPLGDESAGAAPGTGFQSYRRSRGELSVEATDLSGIGTNAYAAETDEAAYLKGVYPFANQGIGINSLMPELAALYSGSDAAVVANVGSLVQPVNKGNLRTSPLPPFLFAHNHQQRAMYTGWADNLQATGWAGRIADLWLAHEAGGINGGSPLGLNVSYGGATRLMVGDSNAPIVVGAGTTQLFSTSVGFDPDAFARLNADHSGDEPMMRVLKARNRNAAVLHELLRSDFASTPDFSDLNDAYGNPLFTPPTAEQLELERAPRGSLLRGLKDVARMIALGRNTLGLQRQVFFVQMGGFDTHGPQATDHPSLLREMSLGMGSFQQAVASLGVSNEVTLCTLSDFGRTLGNNGTGTDHAWAGHNLVVGGAVRGGRVHGDLPDLTLGGESDTSSKGRLIPTLGVDQYLASLSSWFGLPDADMTQIFPNLANFKPASSDPISSAYLNGLMES